MARPLVRLRTVEAALLLALCALVARLAQVQLVRGAAYRQQAEAQRTEHVVLPAPHGAVYDRNGVTLALTQEVYHVGVAPRELADRERTVRRLVRQLGVPSQTVRRRLARTYGYFHGPFTARQVEPLRGVAGVHLTSELVRFYPAAHLARAVLGRPAADGRPASGIERTLDSLLTGRPGSAVVLRDAQGRRYESPARRSAFPVPGHDVYLTLDAPLQEIAEQALADAVERFDAQGGEVVVLDPRSGELLAVAAVGTGGAPTANAFTSVFEPGSTAKVFAAAALLARGLATPMDLVYVERGQYRHGRRTIRDEHAHEWLTLRGVIEQSSNIGIVKLTEVLAPEAQYEMLRDFGFGTPTGVEYPAESPGILKRPDQWSGTTKASVAMGYEIAVTPLQLAQAYAAIANDGVLMRPTLVREVRAPDGRVVHRHRPEPVRRVVSPEIARALRDMLRGVVYRGGTGATAALTSYEVAGKTGTARRAGPGGYLPGSYTASFASLFPAHDPQLVMVVKLDDPRHGYARLTAAPLTRAVLEQALAARTSAIDPARLAAAAAPVEHEVALGTGSVPYIVEWPPPVGREAGAPRAVPDVAGLGLRAAARELHRAGLRVRVEGWGRVVHTDPRAGARVPVGTLVTVVARGGGAGR